MENKVSKQIISELDQLSILLGKNTLALNTNEKENLNRIVSLLPTELTLLFFQATIDNGRLDFLNELQNNVIIPLTEPFMRSFLFQNIISSDQISEIRKILP